MSKIIKVERLSNNVSRYHWDDTTYTYGKVDINGTYIDLDQSDRYTYKLDGRDYPYRSVA